MTPSRLAATLRNIATKIDNSSKPSKTLVARELRKVLAAVDGGQITIVIARSAREREQWEANKAAVKKILGDGPIYGALDEDYEFFASGIPTDTNVKIFEVQSGHVTDISDDQSFFETSQWDLVSELKQYDSVDAYETEIGLDNPEVWE